MNSKRSGSEKMAAAPNAAAFPNLTAILGPEDLKVIVGQYNAAAAGLGTKLSDQYPPIGPALKGIAATLYPEATKTEVALSPANRERCLVAILASRSRRLELAIHAYLALGNSVTPPELAHIVVVSGIYTGIDTVSEGFDVLQTTFTVLKKAVKDQKADPQNVIRALFGAFTPKPAGPESVNPEA